MLIEYKPLSTVPVAETVTDSMKVLVTDGGDVKQTAASNIGSSGSSLPAYTSADIGKVLAVDASLGDAIMESTTVTFVYNEADDNYQAELTSGFDFTDVSDGDGVFIVYDGEEIYSTVSDEDSSIVISSTDLSFTYASGTLTIIGHEEGESTIDLYLADDEHPRLIWKNADNGGIK